MKEYQEYGDKTWDYFKKLPESDFESASCIFHPNAASLLLFKKWCMDVSRCECGFIYQSRQPTEAALGKFYKESDAMTDWANIKLGPSEEVRQHNKFSKAVDILSKLEIKSILDIGCGNGTFLSKIQPNVLKHGTEINDAAGIIASQYATIYRKSHTEFLTEGGTDYQCISMWGLFEHIKNPIPTLNLIRRRLSDDGVVVVCVPNVGSEVVERLWGRCFTFCPQHLWYFSKETLMQSFMLAGFTLIDMYTVESEANVLAKHNFGLEPYSELPKTGSFQRQIIQHMAQFQEHVLASDKGYKIIGVFKKV